MGNTLINAVTFNNVFKDTKVSTAFMLGDDNLFMSNHDMDENDIIRKYLEYGLVVKVVKRTNVYKSKFL